MARLLFNRLSPGFSRSALVELETEVGGQQLHSHVASALEQLGATNVNGSLPSLTARLQEHLARSKVLVVIDNVWTAEQLDTLLPRQFGEGSCLVITSRDAWNYQSERLQVGWRDPLFGAGLQATIGR